MEHASRVTELAAYLRTATQDTVGAIRLDGPRRAAAELRDLLDLRQPDLDAMASLGWYHWLRHASSRLDEDSQEDAMMAVQAITPCFLLADDVAHLPSALLTTMVETMPDPMELLEAWGVRSQDLTTADRLAIWSRMLAPTPALSPNLVPRLMAVRDLAMDLLIETGDFTVLDELDERLAIMLASIPEGHPNRAWTLLVDSTLAAARYSETRSRADRDAMLARLQRAEDGADDDQRDLLRLQRASLEMEEWDLDDPANQAHAERVFREILDNAGQPPSLRADLLSMLARLVAARFERGDAAALEEGIGLLREALAIAPSAEQRQQVAQLLGSLLSWRWLHRGDPADAERISTLARELRPDLAADGHALTRRFRTTVDTSMSGDGSVQPADLFERDSVLRRAGQALNESMGMFDLLLLIQEGPQWEMTPLEQRVTSLFFEGFKNLEDPGALRANIAEADRIERDAEAEGRVPWRVRVLPLVLRNYAGVEAEDATLLGEFVRRTRRVLAEVDIPDIHRVNLLGEIVRAEQVRCRVESRRGRVRPETMRSAMRAIADIDATLGTESVSPSQRIHLAQNAARMARAARRPEAAAGILAKAVMLLPRAASWHARSERRRKHLTRFAGITCAATAFTLAEPGSDADGRALQLLEAGRNVLHNQIIASRADLGELRRAAPRLADRYERIMGELGEDDGAESGLEPERRHRAAEGLKRVTAEIRALGGFESFGDAPPVEELLAESAEGPIAALSISGQGSYALIVRPDGIERVELRYATFERAAANVNAYIGAIRELYTGTGLLAQRRAQRAVEEVLTWVHEAVTAPVLGRLGFGPSDPEDCPRMWWAPGGLLSLLPLHAAGDYRRENPIITADRVVSSYTPTIGQLRYARRRVSEEAARGFAVAMPTTPGDGYTDLPFVEPEVAAVREAFPNVFASELTGRAATRDAVVERLRASGIAHFACHATTDPADPASSRILLADHAERPLTVEDLAGLDLDHARLAFLSACSTAQNTNGLLLDEALHLAAACQVGGFRHVIGTLWQVEDDVAAQFAAGFYRRLATADGTLDENRAARAAHLVMHELREAAPGNPHRWSAWTHYGA
ncbi:CHAT domain-containing protein [Glycomyces halotolerans]